MFDLDDPTKSAEDKMSDAVGIVIGCVVFACVVIIGAAVLVWRHFQ